jgi:hydrogenase/urease accessory protein HupE
VRRPSAHPLAAIVLRPEKRGSWASSRGPLLRGLLHGVSPTDPPSLAAVLHCVAVGLFASLARARRAARVDPMQGLRAD